MLRIVARYVATMTHIMERVGIRELRQNLSRYVDRIRAGESFIVTNRGEEIGVLAPPLKHMDPIDRLESEGRLVQRASGRNLIETLESLPPVPPGGPSSEELVAEQRAETT